MSKMYLFNRYVKRELVLQVRQLRSLINSGLFFLTLLFIFPLTMKPDPLLMKTIAPGLVWMALLLALLLSAERLFQQDYEQGVMEQWLLVGHSLSLILGAKICAHWLIHIIPLIVLCPIVALIFSLNAWELWVLVVSLLCGTPALLCLCALATSFGVGLNQKSALMALILLPLTLPVLIFGSGTVHLATQHLPVSGHCALLLACSILAIGFLPFAIAAIIRVSHMD